MSKYFQHKGFRINFLQHVVTLGTLSFPSSLPRSVLCVTSAKPHPSWAFDPVPQCPACLYMPGGSDCPGLWGSSIPKPSGCAAFPNSTHSHLSCPSGALGCVLLSLRCCFQASFTFCNQVYSRYSAPYFRLHCLSLSPLLISQFSSVL